MLRMAELDERKNLLAMKRQMIDRAFEDALSKMRAMDEERARAYVKRLLLESAQGGEEIVVSPADRKAVQPGVFGGSQRGAGEKGRFGRAHPFRGEKAHGRRLCAQAPGG